jgi:hypothetical protein
LKNRKTGQKKYMLGTTSPGLGTMVSRFATDNKDYPKPWEHDERLQHVTFSDEINRVVRLVSSGNNPQTVGIGQRPPTGKHKKHNKGNHCSWRVYCASEKGNRLLVHQGVSSPKEVCVREGK